MAKHVGKSWRLVPHEQGAVDRLARAVGIPVIVAQILLNRGVQEPSAVREFLDAQLSGLHPPEQLPGAEAAAERIWKAVQAKLPICIYGDYDVDGVTGTAILLHVLTLLGAKADFYIPNRLEEGYGLNGDALKKLAESGAQMVVTVDCGIASLAEAELAKQLGITLIVTDHHEFKTELPRAVELVHPRLPGREYPFGDLSGSGVAFKLAWLIATKAAGGPKVESRIREALLDGVAYAALGLIADVMPLLGENRILAKYGLGRLQQQPAPGLKALIAAAGLGEGKRIRAEDVAFKLAPRLNAAGRLGCARLVIELLTTPSEQRANDLAKYLEEQNAKRQFTERTIIKQAHEQLADRDLDNEAAIVLASAEWHAGVIGIVAGRLADEFHRPTILIAINGDSATGSGRSVPGFPLHTALAACSDQLLAHGGHAFAAGLRLRPLQIEAFRQQFLTHVASRLPPGKSHPELVLDAEVPLSALTLGLVKDLDRLEPYGSANPRPRFLASGLEIVGEPKKMGMGERHLNFRVKSGKTTMRAVGWGMAGRIEDLMSGDHRCSLAFVPKINEWNGYTNVEIEVLDFQPGVRPVLA
jgi:single-stranded-DNA-specific exonuclease